MDSYLVIGLAIVGLGIVVVTGLVLVARASSRRDRVKRPLDPDSVDEIRGGQGATRAAQNERQRYLDGTEY